ncbi:MAG: hypothetical protein ACREQN_03835 [Candidatus Binataceae bacterium]
MAEQAHTAEQVIDQGRVWWPPGLPAQETVRVVFNRAQAERPSALKLEDYETRAPFEVEFQFEQQGTGKWVRWTGAEVKFKKPGQRGRPFRWSLLK